MQVAGEFEVELLVTSDEFRATRMRIGYVGENIVFVCQKGGGWGGGALLFERRHTRRVAMGLDDLLVGRLTPDNEYALDEGKDKIIINPLMPRTALSISISNLRRVVMDGLEAGGWHLQIAVESARQLRDELMRMA